MSDEIRLVDIANQMGRVEGLVTGLHMKIDLQSKALDNHIVADDRVHQRVAEIERAQYRWSVKQKLAASAVGIAWTVVVWLVK